MKKSIKTTGILLLIGLILILVGGIVFTVAMANSGWDFSSLSSVVYENGFYERPAEQITDVEIDFDNSQILFLECEQTTVSVDYPVAKDKKGSPVSEISIIENGGKLVVKEKVKWFSSIFSINTQIPTLTVKVPIGSSLNVTLKTDNGKIKIGETDKAYSFGSLNVQSDNGAFYVYSNLTVSNGVNLELDNGTVSIEGNLNIAGKLAVTTDNGTINALKSITAEEIYLKTDNGAINCSSGSLFANRLTAESDVGEITLTLKGKKEDYTVMIKTDIGKSNISSYTSGTNAVSVSTDIGSIGIYFTET